MVLLTLAIAGCVGGQSDTFNVPGRPSETTNPDSNITGNLGAFRFASEPGGKRVAWANGTIAAFHDCGPACENVTDVTSLVPSDVPASFAARLVMKGSTATITSDAFLDVRMSEGGFWYTQTYSISGTAEYAVEGLMLRRGATVEVAAGSNVPHAAPSAYSLEIMVAWDPEVVPREVPAGFDALPDSPVEISADADGAVAAAIYGPDGTVAMRIGAQGPVVFTPEAAGRHVVVQMEGGGNLSLKSNGTSLLHLEPMRYERVVAPVEPYAAAVAAPYSWTFQADEVPVAVGVSGGAPGLVGSSDLRGHLLVVSPEGVVIDEPVGCGGTCIYFGLGAFGAASERAHPKLAAGEYEVTYTPSAAEAGIRVHFMEFISRA